jgi:hypothetical protein
MSLVGDGGGLESVGDNGKAFIQGWPDFPYYQFSPGRFKQ